MHDVSAVSAFLVEQMGRLSNACAKQGLVDLLPRWEKNVYEQLLVYVLEDGADPLLRQSAIAYQVQVVTGALEALVGPQTDIIVKSKASLEKILDANKHSKFLDACRAREQKIAASNERVFAALAASPKPATVKGP